MVLRIFEQHSDDKFDVIKNKLRYYDTKDVAEKAGISNTTLTNWLSGKTKSPQLRTITAVAEVIGLQMKFVTKRSSSKVKIYSVK